MYAITNEEYRWDYGATGTHEILQNVAFLLATAKGSCPMDRLFGASAELLDAPGTAAVGALKNSIFQALKKYEPRFAVDSVQVRVDGDQLKITVNGDIYE